MECKHSHKLRQLKLQKIKKIFFCKAKKYGSYHADLGLLTRAGWAHESLQLLSDLLVLLKNLSELLHKVLRLPRVWQVFFNTEMEMERCFPLSERFSYTKS